MTRRAPALVVVDVQNDFCEGGSLPVPGGAAVAARITDHVRRHPGRWVTVVATRDWHRDPGEHFAPPGTTPDYDTTWPVHCAQGTPGAAFHPALELPPGTVIVSKGARAAAFSGFQGVDPDGRSLARVLTDSGATEVEVVGLAESHCVAATAIDAVAAGWPTRVLTDLTAGVSPETTAAAVTAMTGAGVRLVPSGDTD